MKITIKPGDADVVIDTDDATQAAALIRAMWNGSKKRKAIESKPRVVVPEEISLSKQLTETWNYLVAHDNPGGVTSLQVGAGLKISQHAATWRLSELISKGVVYRVKRGYYRPGERGES